MGQAFDEGTAQPVAPPPGDYVFDRAHSSLSFVARHMMVTKVRGHFGDFSGAIHVGKGPEDSSVEVTIQAASINTDEEQRDGHLRSPDFLDVENFPQITFRSTKVEQTGDAALRVTGDLTIRDVTREVVLEGEYSGTVPDMRGGLRTSFSATTELDRDEFGVLWNVALETGGWLVSKKVKIELEVAALNPEGTLPA